MFVFTSPYKCHAHLASSASRGATWCWAEAQIKAAVAGAAVLIVATAVGEVLLFKTYRLCSAIIDDCSNKWSLINPCLFNIPTKRTVEQ